MCGKNLLKGGRVRNRHRTRVTCPNADQAAETTSISKDQPSFIKHLLRWIIASQSAVNEPFFGLCRRTNGDVGKECRSSGGCPDSFPYLAIRRWVLAHFVRPEESVVGHIVSRSGTDETKGLVSSETRMVPGQEAYTLFPSTFP